MRDTDLNQENNVGALKMGDVRPSAYVSLGFVWRKPVKVDPNSLNIPAKWK